MAPVVFGSVDIGQNAGVVHRYLESITKVTTNHGSGPLGEVLFQEVGKGLPAEEDGVAPPSPEERNEKWGAGSEEVLDQRPNRIGFEKGVVHRTEEYCRHLRGESPDPRLEGRYGSPGRIRIVDHLPTVLPCLLGNGSGWVCHNHKQRARPSVAEAAQDPGQEARSTSIQESLWHSHSEGSACGRYYGRDGMRHGQRPRVTGRKRAPPRRSKTDPPRRCG